MQLKTLSELTKTWKLKPKKLLLGPPIGSYTPEGFIEYVKSLYNAAASKGSKSVDGVTLTFGKRIIVRIKRNPKAVTRDEVVRLAEENEQDEIELITLLHSRKVGIVYATGDARQELESHIFRPKEKVKRAKAEPKTKRARKIIKADTSLLAGDSETNETPRQVSLEGAVILE